jgi:hypothetical protein
MVVAMKMKCNQNKLDFKLLPEEEAVITCIKALFCLLTRTHLKIPRKYCPHLFLKLAFFHQTPESQDPYP